MNAITQQNNQAMLHDHYNQANNAFQEGDFARALKELEQALQYAENEKQAAHIQQSIRTVSEMMQQEPTPGPTQSEPEYQQESHVKEEQVPHTTSSNKLVLLTVLVGLICLMPIVMKCIEIFTQPAARTEQAQTTTNTTPAAPGSETANTAPASPAATPAVIVEAGAAAKWTVIGNGINMRDTASTKGASLAKLSAGESVKMLESNAQQADNYTCSKIETSAGTQGWVASQFLKQEVTAPAAVPPADAAAVPAQDPAVATTTTTTTTTQAAPASAVPATDAASPAAAAGVARNISGSGVSLRASAGTQGALITILSPSQITVLPDAPVQADGFNWVKIRTSQGTEGWIADKFLGN